MRAVLNGVLIWDSPMTDFAEWHPPDPKSFTAGMTAYVSDTLGGDSDAFDFDVCTPDRLTGHAGELLGERPVNSLHGIVVMAEWNPSQLRTQLEEWCSQAQGPTWEVVSSLLHRHLRWEFDYRLSKDPSTGAPQTP